MWPMRLKAVNQLPREPGHWTPVRLETDAPPTGVIMACPSCSSQLHLGPSPHPSGHEITWASDHLSFSIPTLIICGITKSGKRCPWEGFVLNGVVYTGKPEVSA